MSGTLERCSLHGWILVFTVLGRWQTACMALCGWAVCWCQHCGSSGPWWRWAYGMSRCILWTTNTGAFYWWHFECTEIPWRDPEAHRCAIHPRPLPPRNPNTIKLHILQWPFIGASLRHTCAIIMLSNQHLDMPHLWGGWIISAK